MSERLQSGRRLFACSVALGFVLACSTVVGQGFSETLSFEGSFGSAGRTLATAGLVFVLTAVFSAIAAFLFRAIEKSSEAAVQEEGEGEGAKAVGRHARTGKGDFRRHLESRLLRYFLLLAVAWLPVFIVHFPGTLTYDNYVQMMVSDGLTVAYSAHNPPFDTWLYGLFWGLGDMLGNRSWGLAAYTLCQLLLTALGMAGVLCWLRCIGVPKPVRAVLGAAACLVPLFPLAAECMTKDFTFATVFLFWCLMLAECVRTKGRLFDDRKMIVAYFLVTVVMMMAKKTGVYVAVPSALVVLAVLRKDAIKMLLSTVAAAFTYLVLFEMVFYSVAGIAESSSREMYSVPMQQTARCALEHPGDVTQDENAAISAVFGEDWQSVLPSVYNPTISDPVKALYAPYASTRDTLAYFSAWASQGLRHPITYLESFCANTYECVWPGVWLQQELEIPSEWDSMEFAESLLIYARDGVSAQDVYKSTGGIASSQALSGIREAYNSALVAVVELPVVGLLFSKAFYAFWIPAFVLAFAVYRKNLAVVSVIAPAWLCFFALLAGPVSQARYVAPELFVSILLLGSCWLSLRPGPKTRAYRENAAMTGRE